MGFLNNLAASDWRWYISQPLSHTEVDPVTLSLGSVQCTGEIPGRMVSFCHYNLCAEEYEHELAH